MIGDCEKTRQAPDAGRCVGTIVKDRYVGSIAVWYHAPNDMDFGYNTEEHANEHKESAKIVAAAKTVAMTFNPEGRDGADTKPNDKNVQEKTIEGRAYALDFLGLEQIIPYAKIELELDGETYNTVTDMEGNYSFDVKTDETDGKITLTLAGYRDDVVMYEVLDELESTSDAVTIWRDIDTKNDTNFVVDVALAKAYKTKGDRAHVRALVDHYFHLAQAYDYAQLMLMADLTKIGDKNVAPLALFAYARGADHLGSSYYDNEHGTINLTTKDSSYTAHDSPLTVFHEFGHHLMYTQNQPTLWDSELNGTGLNHAGIMNDTTTDSLQEGYATFFALLMAQEYGHTYPHPHKPSPVAFGKNWEANYMAWTMEGTLSREEFAVVTLLYDLIDKYTDKNDNIYMELATLWEIIKKENVQTVKDLYDELIQVEDKVKVDALFIDHGFFWDKQEGDKQFSESGSYANDSGESCDVKAIEPALDINKDRHIDITKEVYMDYSNWHQYPCVPTFDEGDVVGYTGSHQTTERKTFEHLPNRFLDVNNGSYTQDFTFPNNPEYNYTLSYEVTNNLMPVIFPPAHYDAKAEIKNANDESQNITLSTDEYNTAITDTTEDEAFKVLRTEEKKNLIDEYVAKDGDNKGGFPVKTTLFILGALTAVVLWRKRNTS